MTLLVCFQVHDSQKEALRDGVTVPSTVEEYCVRTTIEIREEGTIEMDDFFDEDMDCIDDDDDIQEDQDTD